MVISGTDLRCSPHDPCAKEARKWHADNGPPDMQPLPLGYSERGRSRMAALGTSSHGTQGRLLNNITTFRSIRRSIGSPVALWRRL
jgi:hypothetical protein